MTLTGTFRTTRFSDLLKYYAISKESGTLRIWLTPKKDPDGVFEFANGQLVEAFLQDARGKDAIRRALTLRDGSFEAAERELSGSDAIDLAVEELAAHQPPLPTPAIPPIPVPTMAPARRVAGVAAAAPMAQTLSMESPISSPVREPSAEHPVRRPESVPPMPPPIRVAVAVASATPAPMPLPAAAPVANAERTPAPVAIAERTPAPVAIAERTPAPVAIAERTPAPVAIAEPTPAPVAVAERTPAPVAMAEPTPTTAETRLPPAPVPAPNFERRSKRWPFAVVGGLVAVAAIAAMALRGGEGTSAAPVRPSEPAPPATAAGAEPAATPPTAKSAAPRGVLPDTLVLGMVSSFTGSNKERGRAMRLGWEMAISEANEAGGVHGRKLRLVLQDDGYDPKRTLAGMKAVLEDSSAFAIVGNVGTATAAVAIPYAGQHDAVFFGALSGADLLRKTPPDRHVFNFRASLAREAEAAVHYLVDVRRVKPQRIAVVAQDDDFGASGRNGALRQLAAYGVTADHVLQLSYPRNTTDMREALAELRAKRGNVDAVVMVATYKPAATLVRKSRDAGLGFFFTTVSADSNGLAEELLEAGSRYTRGVLVTQVVPVPTSHATTLVRYRQALEKYAPGEKPGSTSLEAWLGAQIFLEGVRRAGRELDTRKLITALESIRDWDMGIGGNITFASDDHQGCDVVWGWLLEPDGTYRQVDLE